VGWSFPGAQPRTGTEEAAVSVAASSDWGISGARTQLWVSEIMSSLGLE